MCVLPPPVRDTDSPLEQITEDILTCKTASKSDKQFLSYRRFS